MRDDLLDAYASVNWAISQLPPFEERIGSWLDINVEVVIEDVPPPATHNPIVAVEKTPFPPEFNVEAGACLNAIRSSLDILASALATRTGKCRPKDAYFPVAESAAQFASLAGYKGSKFVEALPATERAILESLQPYRGGNDTLGALHDMDIIRKHRRLIEVAINPGRLTIIGPGRLRDDFQPLRTGGFLRANEKTILGLLRKGAPNYKIEFVSYVAVSEAGPFEGDPIVPTLNAGLSRNFVAHLGTFVKGIIPLCPESPRFEQRENGRSCYPLLVCRVSPNAQILW
jgi:hypothetical protein